MSPQIAIVLVAVFVSIALAVGAIASQMFRWSTPEQREINKLKQRTFDGVFTNVELTGAHIGGEHAKRRKTVLHLLKAGQNRLPVVRHGGVVRGLRQPELRPALARVEQRFGQLCADRPEPGRQRQQVSDDCRA